MKFFVCSDIHSAYTPWMKALDEAGFDESNDEHKIIVCGDLFDRMDETKEVYEFALDMINKDKLIYVAGNHELLLKEMLRRKYSLYHDHHNGTVKTFYHLRDMCSDKMNEHQDPNEMVQELLKPLWDKMVNYYCTKKYVFCHGFLPTVKKEDGSIKINQRWKGASQKSWNDAMWLNGMGMVDYGLYLKNKTIVVGHFHASWGHAQFEGKPEWGEGADFSPCYYEDKLIAIDACTAHTGKVNVVVLEDDEA